MATTTSLFAGTSTVLVNAATTTGTAAALQFCTALQQSQNVNYVATGTYSVCTVDLETSVDNGTTWIAMVGQTALDLKAALTGVLYCPLGQIFRLDVKTFTGTSITVRGYVA